MQKPAITEVPIADIIANRWSSRAYDANKPVTPAQIVALLEAARWAPSSYNDQPWRFIVCDKNTDLNAWQAAFDCLMPANQIWLANARVLVLCCANTVLDINQQPNRFAQYDMGAAVENLCLQATHLGLMTHQMGGYDSDKARSAFAVPAQFTLMAMVSVGYMGDQAQLNAELLARDTAARKRKNLTDLSYAGSWGKPFKS